MYVRTKENRYSGGYSGTVIAVAIAGVRLYEREPLYADRVPRSAIAVATMVPLWRWLQWIIASPYAMVVN